MCSDALGPRLQPVHQRDNRPFAHQTNQYTIQMDGIWNILRRMYRLRYRSGRVREFAVSTLWIEYQHLMRLIDAS